MFDDEDNNILKKIWMFIINPSNVIFGCLILLLILLAMPKNFEVKKSLNSLKTSGAINVVKTNNNTNENIVPEGKSLVINPMMEYDYMTQKEIFNIRKAYVKKSLFNSQNYFPNLEVFGQIQSKKPWWGVNNMNCYYPDKSANINKEGLSSESKFINNPNMLVGVLDGIRYKYSDGLASFCKDEKLHLMPIKMTYLENPKTITAVYKADDNFLIQPTDNYKDKVWLQLVGVNARDFGYNWVFASKTKNIKFNKNGGFTDSTDKLPTEFVDFIHTGGSCGIEGGCNNGSPYVQANDFHLTGIPATMTLHLWKEKPLFKVKTPDITYKIIFER
ncbi:MAG: hypothetical protein LKG27_05235 [Clostridiaceae bacterium]|jgi:hypothetical protein|nr:hypothetical protein [Clostridiaceae bacterium]